MKKLYYLMMVFGIISMAFTACGDDDDITVGPKTNSDSINVVITTGNEIVMPSTAKSFEITLERNKNTGDISVPISLKTGASGIFSAPATVDFANGELTKTVTISVSEDIKMFKDYFVEVIVDQNYTLQYAANTGMAGSSRVMFTVIKEDYKVVSKGKYTSAWTEEPEDAELEYSEILDCYRFNKQTSGVFTYTFTLGEVIDDEEDILNGMQPITFSDDFLKSGCVTSDDWAHPTYGTVTIKGFDSNDEQPSFYDPAHKVYYFDIEFTVAAGSFGDYYDTFEAE